MQAWETDRQWKIATAHSIIERRDVIVMLKVGVGWDGFTCGDPVALSPNDAELKMDTGVVVVRHFLLHRTNCLFSLLQ